MAGQKIPCAKICYGPESVRLSVPVSLWRSETGAIGYKTLLVLLILVALGLFFFRTPSPCKEPLTYRIGAVDERFGLSREEFAVLVKKAADVWCEPFAHDLLREEPDGKIVIDLIYDYRQEASDKLRKLNYTIRYNRDAYDELRTRHENLKMEYEQMKADLERDLSAYDERVRAFNAESEIGRRQGGLSEESYQRMLAEKDDLYVLRDRLQSRQDDLKRLVDTMNSLVVVINEIAAAHNLGMVQYRNEGQVLGDEFSKGYYIRKGFKEKITIYQYDGENSLVRVLVHEFGHALGIEHINDPHAVMNRLVHDEESFALSPSDVEALKRRCN